MIKAMTRAEILTELEDNTHILFTSEILPIVNTAFGVDIKPGTYEANPADPKGLKLDNGTGSAEGISARDLAVDLCKALGVEFPFMFGRGFQVSACVAAIRKAGKDVG